MWFVDDHEKIVLGCAKPSHNGAATTNVRWSLYNHGSYLKFFPYTVLTTIASRLQRWALIPMGYSFHTGYKGAKDLAMQMDHVCLPDVLTWNHVTALLQVVRVTMQ